MFSMAWEKMWQCYQIQILKQPTSQIQKTGQITTKPAKFLLKNLNFTVFFIFIPFLKCKLYKKFNFDSACDLFFFVED